MILADSRKTTSRFRITVATMVFRGKSPISPFEIAYQTDSVRYIWTNPNTYQILQSTEAMNLVVDTITGCRLCWIGIRQSISKVNAIGWSYSCNIHRIDLLYSRFPDFRDCLCSGAHLWLQRLHIITLQRRHCTTSYCRLGGFTQSSQCSNPSSSLYM